MPNGRTHYLRIRSLRAFLVSILMALSSAVSADLVNLGGAEVAPNIVEIEIQDNGVHVRLEVFVGDLASFADLIPAEWLSERALQEDTDHLRIERFSRQGLLIQPDGADPIVAEVVSVERRMRVDRASPAAGTVDPYSGRRLPKPPDDPRVMFVELFYPFGDTRPRALTIAPPLDQTGRVRTSIGMVVFHRAVPVIDFRFLSAPATLVLDWDDPWNSKFDNPNLIRHHRSSRMVFLYAEPYEIRQEALVRVRDATELVGLEVASAKLAPEQAQALVQATVEEIAQRSQMMIDDQPTVPDFDRSAFMRIGMRGFEFLEPGEEVDVDADILGLIWSAPVDGLPQQAQLEWDWYDETAPEIAAYSIDAAGPFLSELTPEYPVLLWTNHFKVDPHPDVTEIMLADDGHVPALFYVASGIGLLGAGLGAFGLVRRQTSGLMPTYAGVALAIVGIAGAAFAMNQQSKQVPDLSEEELAALTEDLLNNVYRAFNFRTEDQVYDRLALTLHGGALEEVYLAQRDALRIDGAGGADARVTELEVRQTTLQPSEPDALTVHTDWTVTGRVGHWGHAHNRTNAYLAELVVAPVNGSWKILDFDVLREDRLQ